MPFKKGILIISLLLAALTISVSGCAAVSNAAGGDLESSVSQIHSQFENQKIAKIEVRSADDNHLIRTIDDRDVLAQFAKKTASDLAQGVTKTESETKSSESESSPNDVFVVYKNSAAVGSNSLEEIYRLTTYADSSTIQVKISSNAVKNMKLPDNLLTFSFQTSDSVIAYLNSLTEN